MKKGRSKAPAAFWDTSGIIPLCCQQPQSARARQALRAHSEIIVWWATPVEAISAFCRLHRQGLFSTPQLKQSEAAIEYLRQRWHEIQPLIELQQEAERILHLHALRAADALQLAAALIWCHQRPRGHHFISADSHLLRAADRESFAILDLN